MNRPRVRDEAAAIVGDLGRLRFANVFNPYIDVCPDHDVADAPRIRRRNLEAVLNAAIGAEGASVWIARDLGYRGGRRTGLALTDDLHITPHGALWSLNSLKRATKGPPMRERTAAVVWQALRLIDQPIFLWNIFPLHPHEPGDPLSNRCHTRRERAECDPILSRLLRAIAPKSVIAIGRDAHAGLPAAGDSI